MLNIPVQNSSNRELELKVAKLQLLKRKFLEKCKEVSWLGVDYILSWNNINWFKPTYFHKKWHLIIDKLKENAKLIKEGKADPKDVKTKALFIAPRGHGKSMQLVVGRFVYEIGMNPNIRAKIVCNSEKRAFERISAVKDHIENNDHVHELFPDLAPQSKNEDWSKTHLVVRRSIISPDPTLDGYGILTTAVGGRSDFAVFDDVVDERNAISYPKMKEQIKRIFFDVWMNILEPWGVAIVVATPWTNDDLYAYIEKELADQFYIVKDVIKEDLEPIWPEKFSKQFLMNKKRENERAFARAFLCKPIAEDEIIFNEAMLTLCFNKAKEKNIEYAKKYDECHYFMGVDLNAKIKTGKSRGCIFIMGVFPDGTKYPAEILVGKWSSPDTARLLIDRYFAWGCDVAFVENNAYQEAILQWIADMGVHDINLQGIYTGAKKMSEVFGVPSLAIEFQNGIWAFPDNSKHDSNCTCGLCEFINELKSYPLGKTDDTIMACFFAKEAYRQTYGDFLKGMEGIRVYEIENDDGDLKVMEISSEAI